VQSLVLEAPWAALPAAAEARGRGLSCASGAQPRGAADVYHGRGEEVLARRRKIIARTMAGRRRRYTNAHTREDTGKTLWF
jgi:hypothetical protein